MRVVDAVLPEHRAEVRNHRVEAGLVGVTHRGRHRDHLAVALEVAEPRRTLERKAQLVRVQDLEHHDVGAAVAEVLQALDDAIGLVEQIRDQHDQSPLPDRLHEVAERLGDVGPGARA